MGTWLVIEASSVSGMYTQLGALEIVIVCGSLALKVENVIIPGGRGKVEISSKASSWIYVSSIVTE